MTSPRRKSRATLSALALCAILAACTTMTGSSDPIESRATFCAVAKPILWSERDTDATIEQVKEYNAVGAALCLWTADGIPK